jgi:hypothetical protein
MFGQGNFSLICEYKLYPITTGFFLIEKTSAGERESNISFQNQAKNGIFFHKKKCVIEGKVRRITDSTAGDFKDCYESKRKIHISEAH